MPVCVHAHMQMYGPVYECLRVCGLTRCADVPNNGIVGTRSPCLPGIYMGAGDPDVGPYTWVASALSTSQTQGPNSEKFHNPLQQQ